MYLSRKSILKKVLFSSLFIVIVLVTSVRFSAVILNRSPVRAFLRRVPMISKLIPEQSRLVAVRQAPITPTPTNSEATPASQIEAPVPTDQDLKIGALKKEEVPKSDSAPPQEITMQARVQQQNGQQQNGQGNNGVQQSVITTKTEVRLCKAGKLYAWAYLTLPSRPSSDFPNAPIKSTLSALGSPIGYLPFVINNKYVFAVAPSSMQTIINDLKKLSSGSGKTINKDALIKYYTDLFCFYHKAIEDKKKSDGFAAVNNSFLNFQLPLGAGDPTGRLLISRRPGELLAATGDEKSVCDAYKELITALVKGDEAYLKDKIDIDSPEYKACRKFINTPIDKFHFYLETTVVVPSKNKTGLFVPIGGGKAMSGFLMPPKGCSNGDCYILLRYKGNSGTILFNQLGVCTAALGKYAGLTRLPQEKAKNITNNACEGALCASVSETKESATLNTIARAHVFNNTREVPLSLLMINDNYSQLKKLLDPFHIVQRFIGSLELAFKVDENGLYNLSSIRNKGYQERGASIPIPVTCTCPRASEDTILNHILSGVPSKLKKVFKPIAGGIAKAFAAKGYGIEWKCTYNAGALMLSSTFDTPEHVSHAAVNYSSFTRKLDNSSAIPGSPLKCPWYKIAKALGHLNGDIQERKTNTGNTDSSCSTEAIKQAYDSNYVAQPILLYQKGLFTICPPDRGTGALPTGAPSFLRGGCKINYLPLDVYSFMMAPRQIDYMKASFSRLPNGGGDASKAKAAWKVLACMMSLYNNYDYGHIQFNIKKDPNGGSLVEANFVSESSKCLSLTKKDIKQALEYFGLDSHIVKLTGSLNNPRTRSGKTLFKE